MYTEIVKYELTSHRINPYGEADFVAIGGKKILLKKAREKLDPSEYQQHDYFDVEIHSEMLSNEIEERRAYYYTSSYSYRHKDKIYISKKEFERLLRDVQTSPTDSFELKIVENDCEWNLVIREKGKETIRIQIDKNAGHVQFKTRGYSVRDKGFYKKHHYFNKVGDLEEFYCDVGSALRCAALTSESMLYKYNKTNISNAVTDIISLYLPHYYKCKDLKQAVVSALMYCNNVKVPNLWAEMLPHIMKINNFSFIELHTNFKGKILDYYLSKNGVEKGYLNKIVNTYGICDLRFLLWVYNFLGHDLFSEIKNKNFFLEIQRTGHMIPFDLPTPHIREVEKKYMMKLLNEARNGSDVTEIFDYYRMIKELRENEFEIEFRVRKVEDLPARIGELVALNRKIKSGQGAQYVFPDIMVKELEAPLKVIKTEWTPIIMKNGEDYVEEGHFQRHCVGGYSGMITDSFIVSLRTKSKREDKKDKEERVTLQIRYNGSIIQAKGYCNWEMMTSDVVHAYISRINKTLKFFNGSFPQPVTKYELDKNKIAKELAIVNEEVEELV